MKAKFRLLLLTLFIFFFILTPLLLFLLMTDNISRFLYELNNSQSPSLALRLLNESPWVLFIFFYEQKTRNRIRTKVFYIKRNISYMMLTTRSTYIWQRAYCNKSWHWTMLMEQYVLDLSKTNWTVLKQLSLTFLFLSKNYTERATRTL